MRKRTLVVDVDDTISITKNRDYENAKPIDLMIHKLNRMHDEGWSITYATARGQLSSGGDLEVIEKTRRPVLEAWLKKHGVKYDELVMGKPFGDYYIDDKAMTPEMFKSTNFGLQLEDGRSGAEVSRVGDIVIKVCENAQMQVDWIEYMKDETLAIPFVVDSSPSVYRMEYIPGRPGWLDLEADTIFDLIHAVTEFKGLPPMGDYTGEFAGYVKRCVRKLPKDLAELVTKKVMPFESVCNSSKSFCHGDLTLTNIIVDSGIVTFIDPSIQKGVWSSWLIDIGRLMQSFRGRYEEKFLRAPECWAKDIYIPYILDKLEVTEEMALAQELLIQCRIWHHQKEHDVRHGKETMEDIMELISYL